MSRDRILADGPSPARAKIGREVAATLEANPFVTRTPATDAQIYRYPNYMSASQCRMLIELIDSDLRPSKVFKGAQHRDDFRTSQSCDLDRWPDKVGPIETRFAQLLGQPADHGEALQGQRYAVGEHFMAHCDYFNGDQPYWPAMEKSGGQRTWTAMVYLNAVEEGGATWFPRAGLRFRPEPGLLITWNNMKPDGSPNYESIHEGMRVIAGTKYVVTKWFREKTWVPGQPSAY